LNKKLQQLIRTQRPQQPWLTGDKRNVVNLSSKMLTKAEESVLDKGLNFAIAPWVPPKFEFIKAIEAAAVNLQPEGADRFRWRTRMAMEKIKKIHTNLTPQEEEALLNLQKDKNIKILKSDKGNSTVVMDTSDYDDKLKRIVDDGTYTLLQKNPTKSLEAKVHKAVKTIEEDVPESTRKLIPEYCKPPQIYGLPKIHKLGNPLRIIVSSVGSPCHPLARFILEIIKPLAGRSNSHLMNSQDLIQKLGKIKLTHGEVLCSFDVCNLFPSIPRKEAVKVLQEGLERDSKLIDRTMLTVEKIIELVELCVNSTYFQRRRLLYPR
jgi:ribosomal protein L30E